MDGYKIVYKEPDGTISDTFFGDPITNICFPDLSNMDIVLAMFSMTYPDRDILSVERCSFEEYRK